MALRAKVSCITSPKNTLYETTARAQSHLPFFPFPVYRSRSLWPPPAAGEPPVNARPTDRFRYLRAEDQVRLLFALAEDRYCCTEGREQDFARHMELVPYRDRVWLLDRIRAELGCGLAERLQKRIRWGNR